MTSPVETINVRCPGCGTVYEDWHRASLNLDLDTFSEEYIEQASTATCPTCKHRVELATLIVRGDVWQVS